MSEPEYFRDPNDGKLYYLDPMTRQKIEVRDRQVHQDQRKEDSHKGFFDQKGDRQKVRRSESVQKRFEQLVLDRADPGYHPDVKRVSDDTFLQMLHDPQFQPLNTYINKLQLANGKWVRPILQGEVGMIGATIYVLESGKTIQSVVPEQLERSDTDAK